MVALAFLFDESPSRFAVNHLFFISVRVIDNARNEVRNEEGCGAINPCCSGVACSWGDSHSREAQQPKKSLG